MKGFLATLLVVCGIIAAVWFLYDPYIKPLLEGDSGPTIAPDDAVIENGAKEERDSPPEPGNTATKAPNPVPEKVSTVSPEEVKPKSELDQLLEERYPMPQVIPLLEIVQNWANVPERAYPQQVVAQEPVAFELVVNGQVVGSSSVPPGTPLKSLRLVGDRLTVANLANPGRGVEIDVDKTDFKKRITERYNQFVDMKTVEVETQREKIRDYIEKHPEKLAALTGQAPSETAGDDGDPRFAPVKTSLKAGEVASVTFEEATSFTWNGTEEIHGDFPGSYETVTVHFIVDTIFGKFPAEYKALIKGGRVVGWIDPITEERV